MILTLHIVTTLYPNDYTRAGVATAIYLVGLAFGSPWRGRVVDRKGMRRALAPTILVTLAGWCTAPLMSYGVLCVACFPLGFFTIQIFPVIRQAMAAMVKPDTLPTAFALDAVFTELTFVIAPVLATWLVGAVGSPRAMVITGVSWACAGVLILLVNPPMRPDTVDDAHDDGTPRRSILTRRVVSLLACSIATTFTLTGMDLGIIASVREWDTASSLGLVMALWALGSMIGGFVYGALPRQAPLMPLLGTLVITTALCALPQNVLWLCIAVLIAGLFCAPTFSTLNTALIRAVPDDRRGEINGWHGTMLQLGGAGAAPIVGMAIDGHGAPAGYIAAAMLGLIVMGLRVVLTASDRKTSGLRSEGGDSDKLAG